MGAFRGSGSAIDVPVAALAGLSMAFLAFAAPADLLADLIGSSGLPAILPAAEPPLGLKARLGIGAAGAVIVFALAFILLRWLDRFGSRVPEPVRARARVETEFALPTPRLRRRDHHPDAPARAPLHAAHELGEPALDPWPEPRSGSKFESAPLLHAQPERKWTREPEPPLQAQPEPKWAPEPEPPLQAQPEPKWTPEPEPPLQAQPEPKWTPEPEPLLQAQPEPKWTPEPEPLLQAAPEPNWTPETEPQPHWTPEPEPQSTPEPESRRSSEPGPQPEPSARPAPVIELEADPVENAWRLSRPYDPIVREKHPTQAWPHLEDEGESEAGLEDEAELEEDVEAEDETGFEAETEAESESDDFGLVGSPWPIPEAPQVAPQAETPDRVSAEAAQEAEEEEPVPETPSRGFEPAQPFEPESPAAFAPPPRDHSVEALLARLEQGMALRRATPAPQAAAVPAPQAQSSAPHHPLPEPADDRLQSAIENLQRLAARRD